jgi:hypothetical protein
LTIREGKYPASWIWEISIGTDSSESKGSLSIEVMKTVEIHYALTKIDKLSISFIGREGDVFSDKQGESYYYTFEWSNGNWNIKSVE